MNTPKTESIDTVNEWMSLQADWTEFTGEIVGKGLTVKKKGLLVQCISYFQHISNLFQVEIAALSKPQKE